MRANPTIEDVARAAGVSASSARNFFPRPGVLSAATRARIDEAVRRTGYPRGGGGARVPRRQLGLVGFEVPRAEDAMFNLVFQQQVVGLLWAARTAGFRLHTFVTDKEPGSRVPWYQELWERREVGGFVLTDAGYDDERVPYLRRAGAPFVLFSRLREETGCCWVDNDNAYGSMLAVRHLLAGGHPPAVCLSRGGGGPAARPRAGGVRGRPS